MSAGYASSERGLYPENPIKAGLCKRLEDYPYSSFAEYTGQPDLVDFDCVEQYVSVQSVVESSLEQMTEECLEMRDTPPKRVTDQQAKQILQKYTGCDSASAFQALSTAERDKYIHKLKKVGLSVRQISRLAGMTYYVIQKAK